jgi:hypothetical protein
VMGPLPGVAKLRMSLTLSIAATATMTVKTVETKTKPVRVSGILKTWELGSENAAIEVVWKRSGQVLGNDNLVIKRINVSYKAQIPH